MRTLTDIAATVNRFGQSVCELQTDRLRTDSKATANTGLAKVAVQYSADSFVVNQTLVLRINICSKIRQLLLAAKRQAVK